jgi:hypothetical protein
MPSQKLALAFSQSIPFQRLRGNAALRLLETEARDSAAYASNSAVSYHILSPTIQARSTTAATRAQSSTMSLGRVDRGIAYFSREFSITAMRFQCYRTADAPGGPRS